MRKEILAPFTAISMSMSAMACSHSPEVPQEVKAAQTSTLQTYGCNVPEADIQITDLSADSLKAFGDASIGKAATNEKDIRLDDDLSPNAMANFVIHESLHWCADRKNHRKLSTPLEVPGAGMLTGVEGFIPVMDGKETQQGNTFVEEGVVDWVAKQTKPGYEFHPPYAPMAELTDRIAKIRGFDARTVMELLKNDDLLGFVALLKNKPVANVNSQDVGDIVYMYTDAGTQKTILSQEVLMGILNYQNPQVLKAPKHK